MPGFRSDPEPGTVAPTRETIPIAALHWHLFLLPALLPTPLWFCPISIWGGFVVPLCREGFGTGVFLQCEDSLRVDSRQERGWRVTGVGSQQLGLCICRSAHLCMHLWREDYGCTVWGADSHSQGSIVVVVVGGGSPATQKL